MLTKNCGLARETVVLPTHAIRDEGVQRRAIGAPKESLPTASDEASRKARETRRKIRRLEIKNTGDINS